VPISKRYSDYDPFAWFYNRHWGAEYHRQVLPILDRLVLGRLPAEAEVLDLCCGCGRAAAALLGRGFRVTGLDGSAQMLEYARENAPGASFLLADAREFRLESRFDLVVCLFESLNHIAVTEDLLPVFANVSRALRPDGVFLFDLNGESAFKQYWNDHHAIVEDDNVCICRSRYDPAERLATAEITMFRRDRAWKRADVTLTQTFHPFPSVSDLLRRGGLQMLATLDAVEDLGWPEQMGLSRCFFLCRRTPDQPDPDCSDVDRAGSSPRACQHRVRQRPRRADG
jgi:SAM-dependent methyltransferase